MLVIGTQLALLHVRLVFTMILPRNYVVIMLKTVMSAANLGTEKSQVVTSRVLSILIVGYILVVLLISGLAHA